MPDNEVDAMYCIGGAPEGVVSAAVIRALDGDMHGRLLPRHQGERRRRDNRIWGAKRTWALQTDGGLKQTWFLKMEDMARSDNIIFSAQASLRRFAGRYFS